MACHISTCIRGKEYASSSNIIWFSNSAIHDLVFPALQQMRKWCYDLSEKALE